jgi:3-phenylpropionate/cinnamic acid dioxygenase small subunit
MADMSEQVKLLIDRMEIDDLLTRYTVALDTRQWDLLATVFTPDATIDYTSSQGIKGQFPEVAAWLEKALTAFSVSQHLLGNRQIELDGDQGTGRTYFFNPNTLADQAGATTMLYVGGFYLDKFVRTAGGWRIADRFEQTTWVDSEEPLDAIVARLGNG